MANEQTPRLSKKQLTALLGLRIAPATLRALKESRISCYPKVTVEHQKVSGRYVIRAQESGGAVADFGAYCGFVSEGGDPIAWLQRIDTLGVNGIHARAVVSSLVRIHLVRVLHTYDLLITKHVLQAPDGERGPQLTNSILFQGRQGTLELDLWNKDKELAGRVLPLFYDRGGETLTIPTLYQTAVSHAVAGVSCCGCRHVHCLMPPTTETSSTLGA